MDTAIANACSSNLSTARAGVEALVQLTGGHGSKAERERALGALHGVNE